MNKIWSTKLRLPPISSKFQQAKQITEHILYQNCYALSLIKTKYIPQLGT